MELAQVKKYMNKPVYYDTGQINFEGCSIKEYIMTGCMLRKRRKDGHFYYQAELREGGRNSIIIVDLAKVLTESDV